VIYLSLYAFKAVKLTFVVELSVSRIILDIVLCCIIFMCILKMYAYYVGMSCLQAVLLGRNLPDEHELMDESRERDGR